MSNNFNGINFEYFIEKIIQKYNYDYIPKNQFFKVYQTVNKPCFTKQIVIGESIYHTKRIADFLLYHPKKHKEPIVIEVKWQQSKGSVDEKFPFLIENIKKNKYKTIIIIDGNGYKTSALNWLKEKNKHTYSLNDFIKMNNQNKLL